MLTEDGVGEDDHNCPTSNNFDNHFNRDEKRARALNLPLTVQEIIDLPIDEFNERLTRYELSEVQFSLIRDIRRRGKNKVAAQNCRKRKLDQIMGLQSEVDNMYLEKETLQNEYNRLIILREMARDKYAKLYHFVIEASSSKQSYYQLSSSPPDFPVRNSTNEILIDQNESNNFVASQNVSTPLSFISSPQMIQSEALKNSN
ncbi:Cap-n-collar bZIP protein-like protein [Sarcoptes scabiei]|nr:Cap-n-collar bZIP protein-like protein [Sarcoptes scabiei]